MDTVTPAISHALVSERDFERAVIQLAKLHGWLVHVERPAQTNKGWRTPIQGDSGWVDLILVRERVLFRELKTDRGRVTPQQQEWLERLQAAGADAGIWRPSDWPDIERTLLWIVM